MRASTRVEQRRHPGLPPAPDRLPEVCIPTATAIVYDRDNPFLIVVGESRKHSRKILPGGKIERSDVISSSMVDNASRCMKRELREEIGLADAHISFFATANEAEGDKRHVPARTVRTTLAEDAVRGLEDDEVVLARYGVPDFIFLVPAKPELVSRSEELHELEWVDCRLLEPAALGAAHGSIVRRYRAYLEGGCS